MFISAVSLQMIVASIMFIFPSIGKSILGILNDKSHIDSLISGYYMRFVGFGAEYFNAGIINCFALLLISHCSLSNNSNKIVLFCSFILIAIVGSILSRTTLIGVFLGIGYNIIKGNRKIHLSIIKYSISIIFMFFIIVKTINVEPSDEVETALHFGFEMFYNYSENGNFSTNSSDNLFNDHYAKSNIPHGITLVLGDGLYGDPHDSDRYYKNVDAGYLRLIYYFGITGLFLFFASQYFLLKTTQIDEKGGRWGLKWYIFILLIILNIKGMTDLTPFIAPFIFVKS